MTAPDGDGYDLQAVYAENLKPFRFRWADQWWTLPHLKMLDFELQARIEDLDVTEVTKDNLNSLFDDLMGAEQGARWRDTTRPVLMLNSMLQEWVRHSGGEVGEASASAGSSRSTGRPSKRTSTGSTASASARRSKAVPAATPPGNS